MKIWNFRDIWPAEEGASFPRVDHTNTFCSPVRFPGSCLIQKILIESSCLHSLIHFLILHLLIYFCGTPNMYLWILLFSWEFVQFLWISFHLFVDHSICICKYKTILSPYWSCLMYLFCMWQYNEELHYVEPCLNGTLVQADVTNKDVSTFYDIPVCKP